MAMTIASVSGSDDLQAIRMLFREYADGLGIDLGFQGFEAELAALPGKYAPPGGDLLLARDTGGHIVGCVGLRPFDRPGACEMKRLYVRSAGRGTGAGRALAQAIVDRATAAGYSEMLLDTLPVMAPAIAVYRSLGFVDIPPYWNNIIPGVLYLGRALGPA